jgi:large subunit ribosomal protein L11
MTMAKDTIEVLIEGGKATAAPPLGPALGPMGLNIGQVVVEINNKTKEFAKMKVPVKVIVDRSTKTFEIRVGTPPSSALIMKEAGIDKGAGNPKADKVADLKMEQVIKIAKMKSDSLLGKDPVAKVKEIIGACHSMGVMVEGKAAPETMAEIDKYRQKILSGKTELSADELKALKEEREHLKAEMEKRRGEYESRAKSIISTMAGQERGKIKHALVAAEIPMMIIDELLPAEKKEEGGKPEAKKEEPKKEEKKK